MSAKYPSWSREYQRKYQAEYRAKNRQNIRKYFTQYRIKNRDRILKRIAEHKQINKEAIKAKRAEYYSKNKQAIKEKNRANYAKNKVAFKARSKKYQQNNKEKVKVNAASRRRYRAKHDHYIVKGRQYCQARKESGSAAKYRDRIREKQRAWARKRSADCGDAYAREQLSKYSIISAKDWPQELVEAKKLEIQLKRQIRKSA